MPLEAQSLSLPGRLGGVSVSLDPGQMTAIVGPNGAGKSSLLACLAGLLEPASGTVLLGGEALHRSPPRHRARRMGYLPQSPDIAWDVTVRTLVALGRLPWRGIASAAQDNAAIETALLAMDLAALAERPVSTLSGGERARALAARVLAGEPEWILADEPLANLDLAHAAALVSLLREQADAGRGVVLVLHDLATAMNRADRVVVLEQGRIVADGAPEVALSAETVSRVWNVSARWLGEPGTRALALG